MADVAALYRIAREQGYTTNDLHARLLAAATLGGAHALGMDAGAKRIGHLAVGAMADLAFFDVSADHVDDTLAELVEAGAGTVVATVIGGDLRQSTERWPGRNPSLERAR
jgi:cytosine/adenosine deaminase-related metal-dependent hydrolase